MGTGTGNEALTLCGAGLRQKKALVTEADSVQLILWTPPSIASRPSTPLHMTTPQSPQRAVLAPTAQQTRLIFEDKKSPLKREAPPTPATGKKKGPRHQSVLQVWLVVLALFLVVSCVAFVAYPDEQVSRLLEHSRARTLSRGCGFPCAARRNPDSRAPWFRAGCPYQCGGPWDEQDFGLRAHLVKALGTTYGTLGMLALVIR